MKRIALIFIFLFITQALYADEFRVPFSCYPKKVQAKFEEHNRKLDLSGNDRTEESWGFLESKGSNYVIYTYRPATEEDFQLIMDIIQGRI